MWWRWEVKVFGEKGCSLVLHLLCNERSTKMQIERMKWLRRGFVAQWSHDEQSGSAEFLQNSAEFSAEFCRIKTQNLSSQLHGHQNLPIPPFNSLPFNTKSHPTFHLQDSLRKLMLQSQNASRSIYQSKCAQQSKCIHNDKQAKIHIPQFYAHLNDTKINESRSFSYHKQESFIWTSWTQNAHQANTQKNQLSTSSVGT